MRRREFIGWLAGGITSAIVSGCAKKEPKPKWKKYAEDFRKEDDANLNTIRRAAMPMDAKEYYRCRVSNRCGSINSKKKYNRYHHTEPGWDRVQPMTLFMMVYDRERSVTCPLSFDFHELERQTEKGLVQMIDNRFSDAVTSIQDF